MAGLVTFSFGEEDVDRYIQVTDSDTWRHRTENQYSGHSTDRTVGTGHSTDRLGHWIVGTVQTGQGHWTVGTVQTGQGHWTVGTAQTGTLDIWRQETGHERGTGQDRVQGLLKSEQYITGTLNTTGQHSDTGYYRKVTGSIGI